MSESLLPEWVRTLLAERYPYPPRRDEPMSLVWKHVVLRPPTSSPADSGPPAPLSALLAPPLLPLDQQHIQSRVSTRRKP
ncbi:hypothetical protein GCM10008955_31190 [Deinococcus malanensis]|uniref:Uncharacterized protein n=1 Tax=Deinococcus malanensis TaxID=1706855 RepID=A0ABQ2F2W7_9DEIO|nr:hypothetical protein [Deinococcus malanensis]GGK34989.1 hypothetical protein GCM10008955_31190 [Deinococcus malanensis]